MKQAFIKLHISIILAGFTGVFGKLISLNEGLLVWYRMLITSVLLFVLLILWKKFQKLPLKDMLRIAGVGCILALHWIFFYASIKAANISIGVICFSLVGFFTAILEPAINRHKVSTRELLLSLITVVGILLIFKLDVRYQTGIILGIISSLFCALFTIYNKKVGASYSSTTMLFHEMLGGFLFLTLLMPFYLNFAGVSFSFPSSQDLIFLLIFSFFCTIMLCLLQIQALKFISAFTVNLSYNLEPIYSIILAIFFFGEGKQLHYSFYIGLCLILLSMLLQTLFVIRDQKQLSKS